MTGEIENPAAVYDRVLGPAIFQPLAAELLARAAVKPGERAIDAGCGTGRVTREIARRVGALGHVTGVDMNPAMLAVARAKPVDAGAAPIDWIEARAEAIPLRDGGADLVTCQQMLQFAPDKVAVLREFRRLLRPGGRAVIATFLGSEFHPFHRPLDEILARLLGEPAFAIGFSFGDPALLRGAIEAAGLTAESFERVTIESRFPAEHASLRGFVLSATAGIPSFRTLDGAARERLLETLAREAESLVADFTRGNELVVPWTTTIAIAASR